MFRDWQETLTQSSVTTSTGPIQRMDVWFCVTSRNRAERHNREVMNTLSETTRRSPERYGKDSPHLTKTYHGSRLLVQVPEIPHATDSRPRRKAVEMPV